MKPNLLKKLLAVTMLIGSTALFAQTVTLVPVISEDGSIMRKVSDNGLWAAGYYSAEGSYFGATIWNLSTYEAIKLTEPDQQAGVSDITNDGSIAVGSYNDKPAYWSNGTWVMLPMPEGGALGEVVSVTPDGSKMVGRVYSSNWATGYACMWENGVLVDVNHSDIDHMGETANFNEFNAISADGNTILGCLNYTVLPNRTAFIMRNGEYNMFGAQWYDMEQGGDEYNFYDILSMSPNGNWVTGDMYYVKEIWDNEYYCPFRYDVENDIVELFVDNAEVASFAVDDNGNLYGATPLNYPLRSALVLRDGEWVSFDEVVQNEYGIDIQEATGYEELVNIFSVSADGKTIVGVSGLGTYNWVLKINDNTSITDINKENPMKAIVKENHLLVGGKVANVMVCDIQGRIVLNEQLNGKTPVFNISHLTSGIYIVKMTDKNNNVISDKIWVGNN